MTATAHELHSSDDAQPREASSVPLAELFDTHCAFVWRSLRHLGVPESALDDAVQDVFVVAYRRWSSFRGASTPRTWLFGIARRIAWRHRRSAHVHASRHVPAPTGHEPLHEPFERMHAVQSLGRLLAGLDRDKRAVFVLAEIEGFTAPEVSDALGIPLGTAYSRLRAAWQILGASASREEARLKSALRVAGTESPSASGRQRMWSAIAAAVPALPTAGAATIGAAIGGASSTHAWTMIVALGVGLSGALVLATSGDDARDVDTTFDTTGDSNVDTRVAAPNDRASRSAAAPTPSDQRPGDRAPSDPPSSERTRAASASPGSPEHPDARSAGPARSASPPPTSRAPDALGEELELLRAAKNALAEGRQIEARRHLAAHARRFPGGQLSADRDALLEKIDRAAIDPSAADTSGAEEPER